eukprot:3683080-Rhodomonas_salina.1
MRCAVLNERMVLRDVRYWDSVCGTAYSAVCSTGIALAPLRGFTELGYGATRYVVLSSSMVLRDT